MKINKVTMSRVRAIKALKEYRTVLQTKRKDYLIEIELAKKCCYQLSRGRAIINIFDAFKTAGLNEKFEPRIAIAPAIDKKVYCKQTKYNACWFEDSKRKPFLTIPDGTFQPFNLKFKNKWEDSRIIETKVPLIPPKYLPKSLTGHYLLWEVSDWKVVPKDPILLKKINNSIYAIIATWNLTKLERLIVTGR